MSRFCGNCGSVMAEQDVFCGKCGAAAPDVLRSERRNGASGMSALRIGKLRRTPGSYLIAAAVQLLMIPLWFTKCVSASVLSYEKGFSMHEMSDGAEIVSVITVILLLAGCVNMLMIVLKPSDRKFRKLTVAKVAAVWAAFWFFAVQLQLSSRIGDYSSYNAEIKLTFLGWPLMILCAASVYLTFALGGKNRKGQSRGGKGTVGSNNI